MRKNSVPVSDIDHLDLAARRIDFPGASDTPGFGTSDATGHIKPGTRHDGASENPNRAQGDTQHNAHQE
jgi:hypothetical protein